MVLLFCFSGHIHVCYTSCCHVHVSSHHVVSQQLSGVAFKNAPLVEAQALCKTLYEQSDSSTI